MQAPQSAYAFLDCELVLSARELKRGGQVVALQPRVFDLISYLVRHRDRAVGKDELQEAVWSGVIVTETALTQAIRKARRAVGDEVIKTVHGHGYRFHSRRRCARSPASPAM